MPTRLISRTRRPVAIVPDTPAVCDQRVQLLDTGKECVNLTLVRDIALRGSNPGPEVGGKLFGSVNILVGDEERPSAR